MNRARAITVVLIAALALGACTKRSAESQSARTEEKTSGRILLNMQKTQPIPQRPWSQLRQNLIEIQVAQTDSTQTTSFFFNQGVQQPVQSCPSIGFPIASTTQLTNPLHEREGVAVPQIDPNGVYAGNSTGTYVICVDAQGRAYANYWEGFVQTITGPAQWNDEKHEIELVGPPSFDFSAKKG